MASSQIEIASSSPFVCGLRDHNRHERCNKREQEKKGSHEKLEEELSTLLADLNQYGLLEVFCSCAPLRESQ
jgi:hypothetical protein